MHLRLVIVAAALGTLAAPATAQTVIRAETLHTMAGPPIENGVVVIGADGTIAAVGPAGSVRVPAGARELRAAVAMPGLIDAHSVVGIAGQYNDDHDQDQLERSEPIQPALRAVDAYNPHERLVEWVRSFGVTTVHTGPAPGELVSGRTMIVKTAGNTVSEALLMPDAMLAVTLSEAAQKGDEKSPGTRSKMMSMLRAKFVAARAYRTKRGAADISERPEPDLALDVLVRALEGELPVLVTAHRAQDIANALRLAEEFELRLVLDGAAEAYRLLEEIERAGVPVIVHPTMMRSWEESENASMETAATLLDAGILTALQSGYEDYVPKTRVVLLEAAMAAANGVERERAMGLITIDAARLLGVDERVGSLEVGKDGDVALYDGDPFEYTTHCVGTVIEGAVVWEGRR